MIEIQINALRGVDIDHLVDTLHDLLTSKGDDYTADLGTWFNFQFAAELSGLTVQDVILARVGEKIGRLIALQRGLTPRFESQADTALDIAGYFILLSAYLQEQHHASWSDLPNPSS
ncbi:MAG: hypothetical protein HC888_04120 [Candidatus Competibacteraceae bacterium]|nr:hypothetical protein [Candidatus Competibacteraceae bacterium]